MAKKGLSKEIIIREAVSLVDEIGYEQFSLHQLAEKLNIKTASLYNHIENVSELNTEIGRQGVALLRGVIVEATRDTTDEKTILYRTALAYRSFAKQKPELYDAVMHLNSQPGKELLRGILDPMADALRPFSRDENDLLNLLRAFRSLTHGFMFLEGMGYFEQESVPIDESYRVIIGAFIDTLQRIRESSMEWQKGFE